jgi:hypothetical protein
MVKKTFGLFFIFILLILSACKEDPWVARVDGKALTLEEFENYYYANHMPIYDVSREEIDKLAKNPQEVQRNPYLNRQQFLEQFIRQQLVEKMIDEEGLLDDDKELEALLFLQRLSLVVARYSKLKFEGQLNITQQEIDTEYQENNELYAGKSTNQVEMMIKQKLQYVKYQQMAKEIIDELKTSRKIERNEDIIQKMTDMDTSNDPSDGVLFSIDGDFKVTVEDYNNFYYAQHKPLYDLSRSEIDTIAATEAAQKANPLINRKIFFDQLLQQKLLYDEAMEGEFNLKEDKDMEYFVKIQSTITKIGFYIKKKYSAQMKPTDAEYEEVYQQYKERFQGVPVKQVEAYLKPHILQQKLQMKGTELIDNAKQASVIEYNNKVLNRTEENTK